MTKKSVYCPTLMLLVVVLCHPVRQQYTLHYYSELLSVHLQTVVTVPAHAITYNE